MARRSTEGAETGLMGEKERMSPGMPFLRGENEADFSCNFSVKACASPAKPSISSRDTKNLLSLHLVKNLSGRGRSIFFSGLQALKKGLRGQGWQINTSKMGVKGITGWGKEKGKRSFLGLAMVPVILHKDTGVTTINQKKILFVLWED